MIAIDTSALVAVVRGEAEHDRFMALIEQTAESRLCAVSLVEATIVCESREGDLGRDILDLTLARLEGLGMVVAPVDRAIAELAREGFRRYGKGRHPAGLNFGDCFAYALAKALDAPLLYKGGDFGKTDLKRA